MSMEALFKFYDRLANDDSLWEEFQAKHPKPTPEAERAFAAMHGYEFTVEELARDEQRLTEEQLEQVTGGAGRVQPGQIAKVISPPLVGAPPTGGTIASGDTCPASSKCGDVARSRGY